MPESAFAGCFFGHRGHIKTNNGRPLPRPKAKIIALRRFLCYKGRRIVTLDVGVMIIDSSNTRQRNILTNKCFYQTTAQIMHDFEQKGYANSADETLKVINAYHSLIKKKVKNNFNADYNAAFQKSTTPSKCWPTRFITNMTAGATTRLIVLLKNLTTSTRSSAASGSKSQAESKFNRLRILPPDGSFFRRRTRLRIVVRCCLHPADFWINS